MNAGYAWTGDDNNDRTVLVPAGALSTALTPNTPVAGTFVNTFGFDNSRNGDGFTFGGTIGYNWQVGGFVVGVEGDINWVDIGGGGNDDAFFGGGFNTVTFAGSGLPINRTYDIVSASRSSGFDWFGTARVRLGWAIDRTLIFATGGVAFASGGEDNNAFGLGFGCGGGFGCGFSNDDGWRTGWALGGGVEYAFTNNLTAKIEGLWVSLDGGFAAGLMSGALTQSAAMGTATDAINGLSLPEADRARFVAHLAVADAVCYIFGYAGVILFITAVAPALLKVDLKEEALRFEQALGMSRAAPGSASAWRKFEVRAYRLPGGTPLAGLSAAEAEAKVPEHRLFVHRLRRGEALLDADPATMLRAGDVIALSGPRQVMVDLIGPRAEEIEDKELLDVALTTAEIFVINPKLRAKTLADLSSEGWTRGLYVRSLSRGGQDVPVAPGVVLQRGDLLRVVGPEPVVEKAAANIGVVVAPSTTIDFVVLGLAIFLGGLVGVLLTFSVGGIKISLSTSVGTLLAGLLVGHLRTRYPLFGRIPDGAVSLMTSLGLASFVGLTGIHAGPIFLSALKEAGVALLLGGMAVTLVRGLPQ